MKTFTQFIAEETHSVHKHLDDFVAYCCKDLGIKKAPKITLVDDKEDAKMNASFGGYAPSTQHIMINIAGRHSVDILRTLAHELVHHKQNLDGLLDDYSGDTGSDIENEANARAGVIMRNYGRKSSNIFEENKLLNKKTPSVESLAKKYKVSVEEINKILAKGIAVEKEHTKIVSVAKEIALDHLGERLDYYERLKKVEG